MIHLYVGANKIAEYWTQGLKGSRVFAEEARNTEYQPPGSFELVVDGDGVDLATPFTLNLGVQEANALTATYKLVDLRNKLRTATSVYHTESQRWRALYGRNLTIKYFDPVPETTTLDGFSLYFVNVILRPKFGRWTHEQAETLADYLAVRDSFPYEPGNIPFSDGTFFSDGTGWSS